MSKKLTKTERYLKFPIGTRVITRATKWQKEYTAFAGLRGTVIDHCADGAIVVKLVRRDGILRFYADRNIVLEVRK